MTIPVLFISGGPTTGALWEPLSKKYRLAFADPGAARVATESGIENVMSLAQFADADVQENASNEATRLAANVVNNMPEIRARFCDMPGVGTVKELSAELDRWWAGYIHHHLREEVTRLAALENLTKTHSPVGTVVHEDVTPSARSIVGFFRARGLPTVHVPHAPCHLLDDAGPDIHRETRAEFIAASGPYMADWYRRQDFRGLMEITGAPQWDDLYTMYLPDKAEARQALAIVNERVIAYGTTWSQTTALRGGFEDEENAALQAALKLAQEWKAVLLITMHPNENPANQEVYAQALRDAGLPGLVTRQHFHLILRAADLYVKLSPSNGCLVSAIMGTPSVYMRTAGFDYAHELPFRCEIDGLPEMAKLAVESNGDPRWQDFIGYYNAAHPDGGAAERITEFVGRVVC